MHSLRIDKVKIDVLCFEMSEHEFAVECLPQNCLNGRQTSNWQVQRLKQTHFAGFVWWFSVIYGLQFSNGRALNTHYILYSVIYIYIRIWAMHRLYGVYVQCILYTSCYVLYKYTFFTLICICGRRHLYMFCACCVNENDERAKKKIIIFFSSFETTFIYDRKSSF